MMFRQKLPLDSPKWLRLSVWMLFSLLLPVQVFGQEQIDSVAEQDRFATSETMTVTANKMEEKQQEIPLAVTVFNSFNLQDRNIDNLNALGDFVPNLLIFDDGPAGVNSPSMRGLHADAESVSVTTGLFIDGIPVSSTLGFSSALLDIERVEVLRGPQGTLYGKNTEAGAINIITKKPDNTLRGKVSGQLGEDNKREITFNLSGPLVQDKLFWGFTGQYFEKDGFIKHTGTGDDVDDRESLYGKGQLLWNPSEALGVHLILTHQDHDSGANRMGPNSDWWAGYLSSVPGDREVSSDHHAYNRAEEDSQALKITYDIGDSLTLSSTTTHRVFDDIRSADVDVTSTDFLWRDFDNRFRTLTEELRLTYGEDGWKWLVGVFADKEDYTIREEANSGPRDQDVDKNSYAIFGQMTVPLTRQLSVVGGLRYEYQNAEFEDNLSGDELDESWENVSPKLALHYQFTPQIMAYISAAKGFRSGGVNYNWVNPDKKSYDSEELWSYEVGAKSQFFDNKLLLNGAAYFMDINDLQVYEGYPPMRLDISNSAEAEGYGLELEMRALVTRSLTFDASVGFSRIEFEDFTDDGTSYDGNRSPFAPEYTFNAGAQYMTDKGLYFRGDLLGYGKMYLDKANTYSRDAYVLVNGKIGYEGENLDIHLYGKNIFDKEYDAVGYYGGMFILYSDPREIGVNLSYRF